METTINRKSMDLSLLVPIILLVAVGIVMVYSASSAVALRNYGSDYFFLQKQVLFAIIGFLCMVGVAKIPYKFWKMAVYPSLGLSMLLLVAVYIIGHEAGNAVRWLRLGPFSFQPVELARLSLILYLAYSLSKKGDSLKNFAIGTAPHVMVTIVLCGLIVLQPDFGSTVIICLIMFFMLFIAGVPIYHLLLISLPVVLAGGLVMIKESYRVKRPLSYLDPWQYESDIGYQIVHSLMAFGTGGTTGTGLGGSFQKLFYLPEAHTDFIFAVLGEELGLVGTLSVIAVYLWIVIKGFSIARKAPDIFSSLLAAGISFSLALQICFNLGVVMGLLPTKGLTLPFLSYGGTSLIINLAACGILLNISTYIDDSAYQKMLRFVKGEKINEEKLTTRKVRKWDEAARTNVSRVKMPVERVRVKRPPPGWEQGERHER